MAAKETETRQGATSEITLPAYLDLPKAAGIVGAARASRFLDEVLMVTSGDLSSHLNRGVSLRAMELSAEDPDNEAAGSLREKLKRVRALFAEVQNENK